jgi:serine beta-lactamase-like protein LACTB, mitochondrial
MKLRSKWPTIWLAMALTAVMTGAPVGQAQQAAQTDAAAQIAAPRSQTPARFAAAIEQARKVAQEILARGIPGVSVAVARDGAIVWAEGFGFADLEQRVPVWPATRFRIGSISKPLTADAVALLYEQGRLDLDAPVQRYVPSFPEKGHVITTRELAGHLAGIRHYKDGEFDNPRHYASVLEGLAIFENDPLIAPPGTKFNYSSYGWNLISAVVESASAENFISYMRDHGFLPLGMRDTVADENADIIEHRSRFYERAADGHWSNSPYSDNSYKWASGGFLSTAEDLVRFGSAHLHPGLLKQPTLDLLFTSQRTKSGEETGYGIGWGTPHKGQRFARIGHTGGSTGGTSALEIYPDSKVVVAILTNLSDAPLKSDDSDRIAEPFMK